MLSEGKKREDTFFIQNVFICYKTCKHFFYNKYLYLFLYKFFNSVQHSTAQLKY